MNVAEVKKKVFLIKTVSLLEKLFYVLKKYRGEICFFFACFFLGLAELSRVRPFGIAFLCACELKGSASENKWGFKLKEKAASLLGICVGALLFEEGIFFVLGALTSLLVLFLFNVKGRAGILEKLIASAASSLWIASLGYSEAVLMFLAAPIITLAFSGLFHGEKPFFSPMADSGFLCLAFALVNSLSGVGFGFLSFSVALAVFFSLEGGERGGHFLGALCGFFSALAFGGELIVPFVIGGFVCGTYIRKKRIFSIVLFLIAWGVASLCFDAGNFSATNFISIVWGASLWLALSGLFLDKSRVKVPLQFSKNIPRADRKLSDAIGTISLALSGVSKAKKREREEKTRAVVDGIFFAECETCTGCSFPLEQLKTRLCQNVVKNKKTVSSDFSEQFRNSCSRWQFIEEKINATVTENPYKTSLRIDSLAEDYRSMARILSFGEKRAESRCFRDVMSANKLKIALELKNIRAMHVEALGSRLPFVEISGIPFKLPFPEKALRLETERIFEKSFKQISFETEGKTARVGFKAQCPLKADFYKISVPKKGEIICGDSVTVFGDDDGFFYSIISDGMGSGRDAAVCSRLGVVFLEKLISAGIDKSLAVSMLGNVVSASEDEIFTTVDLLEIDLVRGKLSSIKSGAAPTWILRNERAYSISSKTMPCGIIPSSAAEQTVLDCFSGDTIIMASDGGEAVVADTIKSIFEQKRSVSAKEVAVSLAELAVEKNGRNDDISFCVLTIL